MSSKRPPSAAIKPPPFKRRRSVRGTNSLPTLASILADASKKTVFITGAGLSAASGILTFRHSPDAVWKGDVWTSATRGAWRKDAETSYGGVRWWNDFWLSSFPLTFTGYLPNPGHEVRERGREGERVSRREGV